eukprot:5793937-Pleurochrysis_carterae.AAC.1
MHQIEHTRAACKRLIILGRSDAKCYEHACEQLVCSAQFAHSVFPLLRCLHFAQNLLIFERENTLSGKTRGSFPARIYLLSSSRAARAVLGQHEASRRRDGHEAAVGAESGERAALTLRLHRSDVRRRRRRAAQHAAGERTRAHAHARTRRARALALARARTRTRACTRAFTHTHLRAHAHAHTGACHARTHGAHAHARTPTLAPAPKPTPTPTLTRHSFFVLIVTHAPCVHP